MPIVTGSRETRSEILTVSIRFVNRDQINTPRRRVKSIWFLSTCSIPAKGQSIRTPERKKERERETRGEKSADLYKFYRRHFARSSFQFALGRAGVTRIDSARRANLPRYIYSRHDNTLVVIEITHHKTRDILLPRQRIYPWPSRWNLYPPPVSRTLEKSISRGSICSYIQS